jgi:hypothetical protein
MLQGSSSPGQVSLGFGLKATTASGSLDARVFEHHARHVSREYRVKPPACGDAHTSWE